MPTDVINIVAEDAVAVATDEVHAPPRVAERAATDGVVLATADDDYSSHGASGDSHIADGDPLAVAHGNQTRPVPEPQPDGGQIASARVVVGVVPYKPRRAAPTI